LLNKFSHSHKFRSIYAYIAISLKHVCIYERMYHIFTKQFHNKFPHSKQSQFLFLFLFCFIFWSTGIASACIRRGCKPVIYQAAAPILTHQTSVVLSTVVVVVVSYCLDGRNRLTRMCAPEEDAPPSIYQPVATQGARNRISMYH
jgi:hypothetical protein